MDAGSGFGGLDPNPHRPGHLHPMNATLAAVDTGYGDVKYITLVVNSLLTFA